MNVFTTPKERIIMSQLSLAVMVLLTAVIVVVGPLLTILALNTLGLTIPYTFWTWLAIFWLHFIVAAPGEGS